jgi:2-phospho-L-lactate guanylyltransferase
MSTVAVLPVKRFSEAKQRLARSGLSAAWRRALAEAMVTDVLVALRRVNAIDATVVVTAEPIAMRLAEGHDAALIKDRLEDGQSAAALLGIEHAISGGAQRVLLVPGDCPAVDPRELETLLDSAPGAGVTIVPDRHGTGTNALLLSPADVLAPAFGPDSFARHRTSAQTTGVPARVAHVPSLALDVDTGDDLATLDATLARCRGGAAHTRGTLAQLNRLAMAGAA